MIYLDNNATTQVAPAVLDAMLPYLSASYGNPSSAHFMGTQTRNAVDKARTQVAALLGGSSPDEIVFTSCGTESDNWAILGGLQARSDKDHIVTTKVEHEAVRKLVEQLESSGFQVTLLDVDREGQLDLDQLRGSITADTAIVSIMLANNETGVLFPVKEIAEIVKENSDALFHVDGVNAAGKVPLKVSETQIDLLSISAHKFHGPKGIGALYIRDGLVLPSFLTGGGQEQGRRAGTEAVHQIVGLGAAAEFAGDLSKMDTVRDLRDRLETGILDQVPNAHLNGTSDPEKRLPNTSNISFEKTNGEMILSRLNDLGVCVSTGSACNAVDHIASPVLAAMEIPYSYAMGSIRFSLGRFNTDKEVDVVLRNLPDAIQGLREISGS
ncbi:MAG TPA: aminotransferase class V-fold PLP-dependent enzyme [Pyrinomonadaceae bacterium]